MRRRHWLLRTKRPRARHFARSGLFAFEKGLDLASEATCRTWLGTTYNFILLHWQVFHCDIKPGNCLVAFDRSGKHHDYKPKHFRQAQIKLSDFGVSRVIQPNSATSTDSSTASATVHTAPASAATTATVSYSALRNSAGIAGSEAYMCPEMLQLIHDLKNGRITEIPEVDEPMLVVNDSFGCGCVIAFLCSRGLHPFQSKLTFKVSKNIRTNKRLPLKELEIVRTRVCVLRRVLLLVCVTVQTCVQG